MRPKLRLDELNKALLITIGVCYLLSFVLNRYAGASTLFRLLFAAAAVFLGIRLFAGHPEKRNNENMKFLAGVTAVKDFFSKLKLNYQQSPYFFFVATFGFLDGFIGKEAQQVLKEQTGLPVSAVFNVRMPDNWTPSFDLSDPDKVAKQVADAEPQIDDVIEKIHHKKFGNFMKRQGPMFTA